MRDLGWTGLLLAIVIARSVAADGPASQPTSAPASQPATATLTIQIKDLRSAKGQLIFGVFKTSDGFPTESDKSVAWEVRPTKTDEKTIVFIAHLPPGRYAASVLHDENKSGNMDRNLAGIPKEGYGVTNNPKPKLRAARYDEATFDLPPEGARKTISVQYF